MKDFEMGFFGRRHFGGDARKKFREEWSKMTDEEKLEMMNKRMEAIEHPEDHFSVEDINSRCEAWMKMSSEEKEAFVKERKEAFMHRMEHCGGFFGRMHH